MSEQRWPLAGGSGSRDVDMGEAAGSAPAAAAAAGVSAGVEDLADLDQALGLAAAFFGGDPAAASWAAGDDDAEAPLHAGFDQLGLHDDAELDALMGLSGQPRAQQGQQEQQELSLGVELDSSSLGEVEADVDSGGNLSGEPPLQPAEGKPAAGGETAGSGGAAAPTSQLAASVQELHLDDIDSEPSDAMAPGGHRRAGR